MSRLLTLLAIVALAGAAYAQDSHEVTLSVEPQTVTIGEVFVATVQFTLPAGAEAIVPGEDADFGGAEVRSFEQSELTLPDGGTRFTVIYALALWKVGGSRLNTPAIASRDADGEIAEIEHAEATVTVSSVLPEGAEEIKDIRGPRAMPLLWWHYLVAALPVVALIVAIALLVGWLRSRKRAEAPEEAAAPPLPPAEEALLALDELEREDLVAAGDIKEHYVRLSWIVRNYTERRWRLPALEETTGMLSYTMAGSGRVGDETVEEITALLRRSDLAKFAKHRPEAVVAREDIGQAREIVRATRRREEVAEDAAPDVAIASEAG